MRTALAAIALLALAAPAFATDRVVGRNKPYRTIQAAVAAARSGDRILVGPGVYRENVVFDGLDDLQFIGRRAVWDGQIGPGESGDCLSGRGQGTLVQGFTFRHGHSHVVIEGDATHVTKCLSRNAGDAAFRLAGKGVTVDGNRVVGSAQAAVEVQGSSATMTRNQVRNCGSVGLAALGDLADVEGNDVRTSDGGAYVVGDDASIVANTTVNVAYAGVFAAGDHVSVVGNSCTNTAHGSGVVVHGDSMEVASNRVNGGRGGLELHGDSVSVHDNVIRSTGGVIRRLAIDGGDGAVSLDPSSVGGGTVERNTVSDAGTTGYRLTSRNLTVRSNSALRCGAPWSGGFVIEGDGVVVEDCTAEACTRSGFVVSGASVRLTRCTATNCGGDGFRVFGDAPLLTSLRAKDNSAEGLDNRGTLTVMQGCTLLGNRIDVACDVVHGASFDGSIEGSTYETGGPDTAPEVDG